MDLFGGLARATKALKKSHERKNTSTLSKWSVKQLKGGGDGGGAEAAAYFEMYAKSCQYIFLKNNSLTYDSNSHPFWLTE